METDLPIWIIEETTGNLRPQNRGHSDLKMVLYNVMGENFVYTAEVRVSKIMTPDKALAKLLSREEVSTGTLV